MIELLAPESQDALELLAEDLPAGSLVLLGCAMPELAESAGRWLARHHLGKVTAEHDAAAWAAAGDRWKVSDLEPVLARASLVPRTRHVFVLARADRMEQGCYDRLLRVIEEPVAPTLFVLTAPAADLLPPTLRGRAAVELELRPLPVKERIEALVRTGATRTNATAVVALAGDLPVLAAALARHERLRLLARAGLDPKLDPKTPVRTAAERLAALTDLAVLLERLENKPDAALPDKVPALSQPSERARLRELVRLFATRREAALSALLARPGTVDAEAIRAGLHEVDLLRRRLAVPVSPSLALSAFAAASLPVRTGR